MNQQVKQKREQIAAICREYHVRRLALFGSALRDDFDPSRCDLDLVVEFEPLASGTYASIYFGLIEALGVFSINVWTWSKPVRFAIHTFGRKLNCTRNRCMPRSLRAYLWGGWPVQA